MMSPPRQRDFHARPVPHGGSSWERGGEIPLGDPIMSHFSDTQNQTKIYEKNISRIYLQLFIYMFIFATKRLHIHMQTRKITIATILGAVVLFLFDGAFQAIPNFGVRAVERLETNGLTTTNFNDLTDRMAYIATDKTVSFVATKQADYYDLSRFFAIEFISALVIAFVFALLFAKIKSQSLRDRLLLTLGFSLITSFAIHLSYFNWWGFSVPYTIGVIAKTILGWLLISFIQNRFIYKIK